MATSRTRSAACCSGSTRPPTGSRPRGLRRPAGTFVLNARTDTWFGGATGDVFEETVERAVRYVEAGADCVFVPGVVEEDDVRRLAEAIPAPLNIVAGLASLTDAPTLFSLGVKRVSLGGSLTRAAYSFLERAGRELLGPGTLGFLDGAVSYADLQRLRVRRSDCGRCTGARSGQPRLNVWRAGATGPGRRRAGPRGRWRTR